VLGLAALATLLLPLLVLQRQPTVPANAVPAREYMSITRSLIHQTLNTGIDRGSRKLVILSASDLAAATHFFLARKHVAGHARCSIDHRRLNLEASIPFPVAGIPFFLNMRLTADDAEPQAIIKKFKLGRLNLPSPIVGWLASRLLRLSPMERYGRLSETLLQEVRIRDGLLVMSLNWNRDLLAKAQGMILDLADKERLLVYHDKLVDIVAHTDAKRFVRLSQLMQPLFELARSRTASGNDPVAENRALIVVLGAYVNNKSLAAALPAPADPLRLGVLLGKRVDSAQHFMGSAAMRITGQSTLTDMVGLAKEMNDTHGGSGFSFIDLAADRAGSSFAGLAVRSPADARKAQDLLSRRADESLYMPNIKDLPENLSPEQFAERFKSIQSPEFQAMKDEIDERIRALPLYRVQ
jgi:hypothetical protein